MAVDTNRLKGETNEVAQPPEAGDVSVESLLAGFLVALLDEQQAAKK